MAHGANSNLVDHHQDQARNKDDDSTDERQPLESKLNDPTTGAVIAIDTDLTTTDNADDTIVEEQEQDIIRTKKKKRKGLCMEICDNIQQLTCGMCCWCLFIAMTMITCWPIYIMYGLTGKHLFGDASFSEPLLAESTDYELEDEGVNVPREFDLEEGASHYGDTSDMNMGRSHSEGGDLQYIEDEVTTFSSYPAARDDGVSYFDDDPHAV